MKGYELLKVNKSLLEAMDGMALAISDVKYVDLVEDFIRMMDEGNKKTYVVQVLTDRYNVSERTIYRIVDKLMADM